MAEVERLCERVIIMKRGRIVDDGSPAELIARYGPRKLEEVFLDLARGARADGSRAVNVPRAPAPALSLARVGAHGAALSLSAALVLAASGSN